ncbi:MAG: hypothetical protein FWG72_07635 [Oscillospiraceae bacterium]|nr:hypothetical protein [Oscillospiraceae bacterium]
MTPKTMAMTELRRSSPPPRLMANQKAAPAQTSQNNPSRTAVTARKGSLPRTIRIQSYTKPSPAPSSMASENSRT